MEVTRANSGRQVEVDSLIERFNWHVAGLQSKWCWGRTVSTRVKALHRRRVHLAQVLDRSPVNEQIDFRYVDIDELDLDTETAAALTELNDLGIRRVYRWCPAEGTDDLILCHDPSVGATGDSTTIRLVEEIAALQDNAAKIRSARSFDERHLFIWVEGSVGVLSAHLRAGHTPEADPDIIDELDRVWLCTTAGRAISWNRTSGWELHD